MEADFSGYATKSNLKCSDGRTIMPDAFKHHHDEKVPLVWQHQYDNPENILGHAVLQHRADGTYAQCFFNDTPSGTNAKNLVRHGDITQLSIFANKLQERGGNVYHGDIKEVSLVLAGANPGAYIDSVNLRHGESSTDEEAYIYTGLDFELSHSDNEDDSEEDDDDFEDSEEDNSEEHEASAIPKRKAKTQTKNELKQGDKTMATADKEKTVEEVYDDMDEDQQSVLHFFVGQAIEDTKAEGKDLEQGEIHNHYYNKEDSMSHNVFDQSENKRGEKGASLSHDQLKTIVSDGVKMGSMKDSFLSHADEYGIHDIDLMFPDARTVGERPELLARQADWVPKVLNAIKKAPFAKIKSLVADLTAEEARAKGYIKGDMKKDEVIALLRRTTGPTTVYKKQKLDRDDIIDITDFDVIAWLKWEIRFMLNEELARAILIGDGRSAISTDKIKDPAGVVDGTGIRSIANDSELYAHPVQLAANVAADVVIDEVSRARTHYRGSGSPSYYTTDKNLTDLLLLKDKMNRRLYDTEAALASALRVKEIVSVEVLEEAPEILGILVNLVDYTLGSNKGGEVSFFDDFDINFNQNKYLMETRLSGALTKPKSAIVISREVGILATPAAPSFNGTTNTITVPTVTGVDYLINDAIVTGDVVITETTEIIAAPAAGYYFESATSTSWTFTYTA